MVNTKSIKATVTEDIYNAFDEYCRKNNIEKSKILKDLIIDFVKLYAKDEILKPDGQLLQPLPGYSLLVQEKKKGKPK